MSEHVKVGTTRVVSGDEWLLGKPHQDRAWDALRRSFDTYVSDHGLTLLGEPVETTDYDEQRREVVIRRWGYAT